MKLHCSRIARCHPLRGEMNEVRPGGQELHCRQALIAWAPRMPSWKLATRLEIGSGNVGRLGFAGLVECDFAQKLYFADTDARHSRRPV
jgi:hypothetical protein